MLPLELKERFLKLPKTDNHNIVIMTGDQLRHKRFAYRIQKEFGSLVVAWYELDSTQKARYTRAKSNSLKKAVRSIFKRGIIAAIALGINRIMHKRIFRIHPSKPEEELFKNEIEELRPYSVIKPIKINPWDVHSKEFINEVAKIKPYFLLTLSGPLYTKPLLLTARGVAINQHAGHSPILRGGRTTEQALYHRNINHVSSTVHITTSGADAGPILRRSNPCIFPHDTYQKVFSRVVALGTELMIEVVRDIIKDKRLVIFKQPNAMGRTYLAKEFDRNIKRALNKDFKTGWLRNELSKLRQF